MPNFLVPPIIDHDARLAALTLYDILDTVPEAGFDDAVKLACQVCDTPVALVSFVSSKRQWFKAAVGTELCETPIEQSVCAHALAQGSTLIVPDLTLDERTKRNPLVAYEPHIRFYAGALLKSADGMPLGTLCVIDTVPRPKGLTPEQIEGLEALARQVMLLLELRKAVASRDRAVEDHAVNLTEAQRRQAASDRFISRLQDSERRLRMAQEAGQIGTFDIDIRTNVLHPSHHFCRIFGVDYQPSMDPAIFESLVHPEDVARISNAQARADGTPILDVEYRIRRPDTGQEVWVARKAEIEMGNAGAIRMYGVVRDISERKRLENAQAVLNFEISHRLKNVLAIVASIANQTLKAIPIETLGAFIKRIVSLSRAHEILLDGFSSSAPIRKVLEGVLEVVAPIERFRISGQDLMLSQQTVISMSMLVHELATNAVKHGALASESGIVEVTWSLESKDFVLRWQESGGAPIKPPERSGSGSKLIGMGLLGKRSHSLEYAESGLKAEFRSPKSATIQSSEAETINSPN